jgi:hypothetical protein
LGLRAGNRNLWLAVSAAIALVLLRSFVFLCYEQNFDSDQAIVGLMAKHLSEFRAFPLFFYGQNYMLGVEAWIAVPFFWLGGPTVTMLRMPLLLINIAVVILLIRLLIDDGLQPALALVATLPIAACGPVAAAQVLTVLGASIEPLLYVIVLWLCRTRPVLFGVFLCVGALHREFTIFAVPAIALLQWFEHRRIRWPAIVRSTAALAVTWIAIDQLKRHVNIAGPGADLASGAGGSLALEAVQVGRLLSFHPSVYFARLHLLLTQGLPDLCGARSLPLFVGGIWGEGSVGSGLAGWALAAALAVCAARLAWMTVRRRAHCAPFPIFLLLVSVQAIAAYGLHGGSQIEPRTELNYVLLALLCPVALLGAYFQVETNARVRQVAVVLVAVWLLPTVGDNLRVATQYIRNPPESPHRMLADYLTDHRIKYGWAGYWDSYRVTFLTRERTIVASTETVRIPGYQVRVERNQLNAVRISRLPCDEGTHVAEWCVVDPLQR